MFYKALKNMMVHDSLHDMLQPIRRYRASEIVLDNIRFFLLPYFLKLD